MSGRAAGRMVQCAFIWYIGDMALMPLPPKRITDHQQVSRRFADAARRGISGIWCNHDRQPPPAADWAHSGVSRVPFLILGESGTVRVTVREHGVERSVAMRRGVAVLHAPGAYAWHQHAGPARMLSASLDTDRCLLGAGCFRHGRDLDDPEDFEPMRALVVQPPPDEPVSGLVAAILGCPPGDGPRRLALAQALLWQLAAAASAVASRPALAGELRAWIAARACTPGLGRAAVARAFALSPTHVSRLLAPWGGLAAEIERTRLERVQEMLRGGATLAQAAAAAAFVDASHLARRFRLRFGSTPAAWRRTAAGRA